MSTFNWRIGSDNIQIVRPKKATEGLLTIAILLVLVFTSACTPEAEVAGSAVFATQVPTDTDIPRAPGNDSDDELEEREEDADFQNMVNTYTQNQSQGIKVDILWVIDNSGSMHHDQVNLAANFNSFINNFIGRDELPDFKMAVVTTDPRSSRDDGDGRFVVDNNISVLAKADAVADQQGFIEAFQDLVMVGTSGSGHETDLYAMKRATERQPEFFRDDAILVVNILSDEHDSSINYNGNGLDVLDYVNAVKNFKGTQRVIINSIVHLVDHGWEKAGVQQLEATALTNGISAEINNDFAESLNNIGEAVVSLIDSFPLSDVPYNEEVKVFINDVEALNGWTYETAINTVKFDVPPVEGAEIKVTYSIEI